VIASVASTAQSTRVYKPRTVILGEKPQGTQWLERICTSGLFDVIAGITRESGKRWWGEDRFIDVLKEHHVPQMSRDMLHTLEYDILLSFVYPFIIEPEHLKRAHWYAVNLHESPLPRYRGCNGCSHAILEGDTTYGTTLHTMEAALDAGEIVDQITFPIDPTETAKELYVRTSEHSSELLKRNLHTLASGKLPQRSMDTNAELIHARSSLANLKHIPDASLEDVASIASFGRALDFLPFEPAFFLRNDAKYYVFIERSSGRNLADGALPLLRSIPAADLPDAFRLPAKRPMVVMREDRYRKDYPVF